MIKVSLVITIYNEAENLPQLLESIANQSKKPNEIIFVDAGSTDKTISLIEAFKAEVPIPVKILIRTGVNRSRGRNLGIKKSKFSRIAVTDAGVVLDKDWLKKIVKPLRKKEVGAVAGYYLPEGKSLFQKAVAPFVATMPKSLNKKTFLPSSRSVAFSKKAWNKAGRYPEELEYCEDLVFARNLQAQTTMEVVENAIVYWKQKETFLGFFNQLRNYARGDFEAKYTPHLLKIMTVFIRYVIFLFMPPFFLLYLMWSIIKHWKVIEDRKALIFTPALQFTADWAVMTGVVQGLMNQFLKK